MSDKDQNEAAETASLAQRRDSAGENSDRETDEFEDANDDAVIETARTESVERTRLLTKRRSSSVESSALETPEVPPISAAEVTKETVGAKEEHDEHGALVETNGHTSNDDEEHAPETRQPKSPLLTSHRSSTVSLDNVELADVNLNDSPPSKPASPKDEESKPPLPPKSSKALQGLSGALPSVPWSPPPPAPASNLPTPVPPQQRKLTGPFSWLSRNTSSQKENVTSAPISGREERRNTASSIATIGSNPDLMLHRLDEVHEPDGVNGQKRLTRNSLKDRFKLLRMRDEAGITALPDHPEDEKSPNGQNGFAGLLQRSATMNFGLASPNADRDMAHSPSSPNPPASPNPATVNHLLAPGTASGVSAGPSASTDAEAVDWDLWQAVVDEGPAAVARTSPEELNRAITTGIPNAIRGVVWQILAQSKNEDLESVYTDLRNRGTDKDKDRMSGSSGAVSVTHSTHSGEKENIASSASSIHSDHSTLATTMSGLRSPSPPKDPDTLAKAQAAAVAAKKKQAKEDAAALQKLEKAIKRDLGARTSFSKYAASAGMQDGLFGVCKAYALFDEAVGYAQGMNFLAMPLLFNMPEEEAFCLLVRLMNQYHLRDLFVSDMPGLHMHLYQFERLLEDFEPALYCHLHRRQVTPHLYATQWFLTLFAYRFPLQLVLRIYDLILSEGLEAIIKFGIVLMQKNAATLLGMTDMVALTNFLKDRLFDVYIDAAPSAGSILESGFFGSSGASIDKEIYRADQLVEDACAVKITPEILKTYKLEWEEKTQVEKEREQEIMDLRSKNQALIHKVRDLEQRVEASDTEHAALATEVVKIKVVNQDLTDTNEALEIKVRELKIVIDKQPAEVEEKFKGDLENLLKQNNTVHEQNRKLEEEMSEMEQNLVETKMKYAEINSQHETLSRKWTDLRKAMGN